MNNKVLFGSYVPTNSWLHRLDPRAKIIACFWFVILVFFAKNFWTYAWLTFILGIAMVMTKISFKMYWNGIKVLIGLITFTVAIQILFSSGGTVYWQWGILAITSGGLKQALVIIMRFVLIINASTVLTLTTESLELATGLEILMKPLQALKVPVNQLTMMMSIALRFVPTLMNEVTTIMNAQRSRGVNFNEGSLIKRIKQLVPIMVPLLVSSFKRADELATAMEARGYNPDQARSQYRVIAWQRQDTQAMVAMLVVTIALGLLRIWL
ncbi:ABC transporter permease component [Limosilactobacillus gastricus PS3]|uniref:ABC transporter permease component n=2 Tax=Limosilactobacillus gastricus TaxID=227942 RepID=H4GIT1_9LACO|nr:energy-coupling factor transporter transmembrane component T [Limosilactobacillus gastricus]EHS87161.1 ABC transporter permease component [Limosilactobacillus gastricus PS3]KRM02428.1 ABC transporter permease component [Limosilactobacillus gastricus DSM 16045]QGF40026.1 cobalt ABC transporter ATP-binding protein [Limosilactobacillus gastricus]